LRRSRALEAVTAVERRFKAEVEAAAGIAREIGSHRRSNHAALGRALQTFNDCGRHSAFACAAAGSHRAMLIARDSALADRLRGADERVEAARDRMLPWAQIRCGLERRLNRELRTLKV
jgi:hypothetical protein